MTKRLLTFALASMILAAAAVPATAYWQANGTGTGNGIVDTMTQGAQPSGAVASNNVTVSFAQNTFQAGPLGSYVGGGYMILRYPAAGGPAVTPGGTCGSLVSGAAATLNCVDSAVPIGTWRYTVVPVLNSWTGMESVQSTDVIVLPDPPTNPLATLLPAADISVTWTAAAGAAGYNVYRRTSAGAYNFAAPLNGGTPLVGTSFTDTTSVHGTTYLYVIRSVIFAPGPVQIESVNSAETVAVTADGVNPAGVTFVNPGTPLRATITLSGAATDAGSGMASLRFQRSPAGAGAWTDSCVDTTTPYSCTFDTTTTADGLYDMRALATDVAGNTTASAVVTNRRIDNTGPVTTLSDPGSPIRATVTLTSTAVDAGSGLSQLLVQRSPAGANTWTTICTVAVSPVNCNFNTTAVVDGTYDFRALSTDVAGNQTSVIVANRVIDNTRPTGIDVQTTNVGGGTPGKAETGDTIRLTASEPLLGTSILAGWTGAATPVTLRFINGAPDTMQVYNAANTAAIPGIGTLRLGNRYFTANTTFTGSSMTIVGNTVVLTLGTPSIATPTSTRAANLRWLTSAVATDLAGNTMVAATIQETPVRDLDF